MPFPGLRACHLRYALGCKLWHSRRKLTQEAWPGCFALARHLDGCGREQDRRLRYHALLCALPSASQSQYRCSAWSISCLSVCLSLCEWWIFWNVLFFCLYFGFSFRLSFALTLLALRMRKLKLFIPLGLGLTNIDWHLYAFC